MIERPILTVRARVVLGMLEQAALAGRKCPTNEELGDRLNSGGSYGSVVMAELEQLGVIRVTRFARGREVEIVGTALRTAPISHKRHWRDQPERPKRTYVRRVALPDDEVGAHFRGDVPLDRLVDRDPCWKCGVRADVGCRHRPASGTAPVEWEDSPDGRTIYGATRRGYDFRRAR